MSLTADGAPRAPMDGLTAVAVARIESTLADRWRNVAATEGRTHIHSCALTLIIAVEEEHDNRPVFEVINLLAGKHPIRAITVQCTESAHDSVLAWINARCQGEQAEAICSEEIVLQGNVHATDRTVSAIRGLLAPDLPVFLWWRGGSPYGSLLWSGLAPMCDRIVVDSIRFGDGAAALDTLRRLVAGGGEKMSVRDLNWQRTAPWRAAIASCFDDQEMLSLLPDIDRCSITFASGGEHSPPSARALLMAGWLASRLPRLRGHSRTAPGKRWSGVAAGRIVAVTLTSSRTKASLMLVRQDSPSGIEAQAHAGSGEQFRRWSFRAPTLTEAGLLDACIETLGHDPIFESALEA